MTVDWCCGAECGVTSQYAPHLTDAGAASPRFEASTTFARSGSRSYRFYPNGSAIYAYNINALSSVTRTSRTLRLYFRVATAPNGDTPIIGLRTNASQWYGLAYQNSDSKYYLASEIGGSLSFGATGISLSTGVWYRLDLKVNVSANPHTSTATVDGTSLGTKTAAVAAATSIPSIYLQSFAVTYDIYFDDILITSSDSDYPVGDGNVYHFVPKSDGSHNVAGANDFERGTTGTDIVNATTDSYLLVDDVPMDDTTPDADDYINCIAPPNSTDYVENTFGPASGISTPTTGPRGVEVAVATHQAGTGTGVSALKLNDNGTEDTVWSISGAGATTIRYARKHYAVMPKDSAAWTAARFNDLRIRFGYSSDANPDQYFDCAMIEAEWAPSSYIKTGVGLAKASVKTWNGLASASTKTVLGLT